MRPASPAEAGVGGTERCISRRFSGSVPLVSVQKYPVNPCQWATAVQHHVVPQVNFGDAQLLERELDRVLITRKRP